MEPATLFRLANALVLPGWLVLVFLPRWKWGAALIAPVIIPVAMGAVYAYCAVTYLIGAEGGYGSLDEVATLLADPRGLLAGWVHYLAFDLFVGAGEVRDARRRGIHHGFVVPCLVATLMLGPIGLGLYALVRLATGQGPALDEAV